MRDASAIINATDFSTVTSYANLGEATALVELGERERGGGKGPNGRKDSYRNNFSTKTSLITAVITEIKPTELTRILTLTFYPFFFLFFVCSRQNKKKKKIYGGGVNTRDSKSFRRINLRNFQSDVCSPDSLKEKEYS